MSVDQKPGRSQPTPEEVLAVNRDRLNPLTELAKKLQRPKDITTGEAVTALWRRVHT